jgi:hypothetical protein
MDKPVRGPASYFPSIEKKHGRPIGESKAMIGASDLTRHMELVGWGELPGSTPQHGVPEQADRQQLGWWASTYDAEYVALSQLQADAFVTLDAEPAVAHVAKGSLTFRVLRSSCVLASFSTSTWKLRLVNEVEVAR